MTTINIIWKDTTRKECMMSLNNQPSSSVHLDGEKAHGTLQMLKLMQTEMEGAFKIEESYHNPAAASWPKHGTEKVVPEIRSEAGMLYVTH